MRAIEDLRFKDDQYVVRPARFTDHLSQIAAIIYDANPEVFSLWFDTREHGIKVLTYLCSQPGSFFSYQHHVVVTQESTDKIIAAASVLDCSTRLGYNYDFMRRNDPRADQIICNYVFPWIRRIKSDDGSNVFLPTFSGEEGHRLNRVPTNLLITALVKWAKAKKYTRIVTEAPHSQKDTRIFFMRQAFTRITSEERQYLEDGPITDVHLLSHFNA